jgi:hypothetical protein
MDRRTNDYEFYMYRLLFSATMSNMRYFLSLFQIITPILLKSRSANMYRYERFIMTIMLQEEGGDPCPTSDQENSPHSHNLQGPQGDSS